tara:strand:+ start:178 stop:435 length:258 start_codon:yes stop_codon:yes gene_type:complete
MTRQRCNNERCVERIGGGKYSVRIAMANELGKNRTAYIGSARSMKEAVKIRDIAESCRNTGRLSNNLVTVKEIKDIILIAMGMEK